MILHPGRAARPDDPRGEQFSEERKVQPKDFGSGYLREILDDDLGFEFARSRGVGPHDLEFPVFCGGVLELLESSFGLLEAVKVGVSVGNPGVCLDVDADSKSAEPVKFLEQSDQFFVRDVLREFSFKVRTRMFE